MNKAKQYFEKKGWPASLEEIENYLDSMADLYLIFSEIVNSKQENIQTLRTYQTGSNVV